MPGPGRAGRRGRGPAGRRGRAARAPVERLALTERLARLRGGRQRAGEPRDDVEAALAALDDATVVALAAALAACQLWYCEAATGALSPGGQLRVLAAACGAARRAGVDVARPWHAQLLPLVARLGGDAPVTRYRVRLVEAVLAPRAVADLMSGGPDDQVGHVLGAIETRLGDDAAVVVDFRDSDEASALLTLLAIYETKSSAAFHATLKALCDLYGLRKDELDRLHNEASYLASMNAARSDKARMLDFVRPGRVVEVGPGGGVVLDLLEDRFGDAEIIGIDVSREVVAALAARRARDHRRWRVVEADAFALPDHVGAGTVDTVIFCSVLHEIFSYVEYPGDDGGPPRRFRLEAVRDLVRAAWRTLRPGGRLVIRDGVAPPPGIRRLRLLADDGRAAFALFCAQFEGFAMTPRDLPDGRVELPAHHAMEFLYTYTWGPESFPYEVREQYGVMTYAAYGEALLGWLADDAHPPRLLPLPAAYASYLQPGYVEALATRVEVTDEHDRPVPLPDSNCLIVVEKT
ncbi:MAG: methyltransferase domain-containing protein [Kofleriaceae bacterium]|nr:methyltransferase domain-containing protein [Kofleriaceae bacterium]